MAVWAKHFDSLPPELWEKVFCWLQLEDLYTFEKVHPKVKHLVEDYLASNPPRRLNLIRFLIGLGSLGFIELEELHINEEVVEWIALHCATTEQLEVSSPFVQNPYTMQEFADMYSWLASCHGCGLGTDVDVSGNSRSTVQSYIDLLSAAELS